MSKSEPTWKAPPTRFGPMLLTIGPAIVVSGSVIGAGELINVPIQAATFGFVLFWAVVLSCVIKYFLQVELGRYCLVHNRTTIQALNTCPGPKIRGTNCIGIVYMVLYTLSVVTVAGIMSATAGLLTSLLPLVDSAVWSRNIWAVIVTIVIALILWRGIYGELEKLIALLVCGFSLSVVVALLLLIVDPNPDYPLRLKDVFSGMTFSLGEVNRGAAAFAVISLLGALGTTANELFMYPYWILEKGYAEHVGSSTEDGWLDRARGWVRVLQLDAGAATLLATVITAAYFLVGCAILHQKGEVPSGMKVVEELSQIYTETYGPWSYSIFMFGGFCTLFSTITVVVAASGRMWTDLLSSMGVFQWDDTVVRRRYNRIFQMLYLLGFLAVTVLIPTSPAKLVIVGQWINGAFNTPLLMFGICWLAFHTDKRIRMSRATAVLLIITVVIIAACLLVGLFPQAGH